MVGGKGNYLISWGVERGADFREGKESFPKGKNPEGGGSTRHSREKKESQLITKRSARGGTQWGGLVSFRKEMGRDIISDNGMEVVRGKVASSEKD